MPDTRSDTEELLDSLVVRVGRTRWWRHSNARPMRRPRDTGTALQQIRVLRAVADYRSNYSAGGSAPKSCSRKKTSSDRDMKLWCWVPALPQYRPPPNGDLEQPELSQQGNVQGSIAQLLQLAGYDPVSCVVRMKSVETQISLGFRILIAVQPVEGQIHLGVGYALCVRGGGDVTVDLDDISVENLEVVHPAVTLPGVGDYVGPDVGIVDIHCSHDCVAGRTQLENLCRDGGPVGLECCHASPEAVLIVGPTAGSVLVRGTGCPEIVPADVPGDDLRLAGGAPERRIAAECREQLGTGPFVLAEVCARDR